MFYNFLLPHFFNFLQVRDKVERDNVSWPRAMDEIRADRLISEHGANALFIIIHKWPNGQEYKKHSELLPSLERLVRKQLVEAKFLDQELVPTCC